MTVWNTENSSSHCWLTGTWQSHAKCILILGLRRHASISVLPTNISEDTLNLVSGRGPQWHLVWFETLQTSAVLGSFMSKVNSSRWPGNEVLATLTGRRLQFVTHGPDKQQQSICANSDWRETRQRRPISPWLKLQRTSLWYSFGAFLAAQQDLEKQDKGRENFSANVCSCLVLRKRNVGVWK